MHRELLAHPGLMSLLNSEGPMLESGLGITDSVLEGLSRLGMDAEQSGRAFQVVMAYTLGSVVMARGAAEGSRPEVFDVISRHPRVLKSLQHIDVRTAGVFQQGLTLVLDTVLPATSDA